MKINPTNIPEVKVIKPKVFGDDRGFFFESYNQRLFSKLIGRRVRFIQDNHSRSRKDVIRGLHYQIKQPQGKLVRVIQGEVFDVAVDLRKHSPTFGCWVGEILSAGNRKQMWIPEGFAHGFLVTSEWAEVLYKTTDVWAPKHERCILWNDSELSIQWPIKKDPGLSDKDRSGQSFSNAEVFD